MAANERPYDKAKVVLQRLLRRLISGAGLAVIHT